MLFNNKLRRFRPNPIVVAFFTRVVLSSLFHFLLVVVWDLTGMEGRIWLLLAVTILLGLWEIVKIKRLIEAYKEWQESNVELGQTVEQTTRQISSNDSSLSKKALLLFRTIVDEGYDTGFTCIPVCAIMNSVSDVIFIIGPAWILFLVRNTSHLKELCILLLLHISQVIVGSSCNVLGEYCMKYMRKIADHLERRYNNTTITPQSTSPQSAPTAAENISTGNIFSVPTVAQLLDYLADLEDWDRVASHLPIKTSDIVKIKTEEQGLENQKRALWTIWLKINPDGTWNNIIEALKDAQEFALAQETRRLLIEGIKEPTQSLIIPGQENHPDLFV